MNRRLRRLSLVPLLLAALWLPVAAIAAVAMPLCQHQGQPQGVQADWPAEVQGHPCHRHHGNGSADDLLAPDDADSLAAGADLTAPAASGLDCDQCGFCHLAGSSAPPAAPLAAAAPLARHVAAAPPRADFSSHQPDALSHPPKRLS